MNKKSKNTSSAAEPHLFSKEAEQMVLGCMLSSSESLYAAHVKDPLSINDFYYPEHCEIFLTLESLFRAVKKADVHLVSEELKRNNRLDEVGGVDYLLTLASIAGTSAYFEAYAQDLRVLAQRRVFVAKCSELHKKGISSDLPPSALATLASETFAQIAKTNQADSSRALAEISKGEGSDLSFLDQLREKKVSSEEGTYLLPGLSTGYSALDTILGGFREENLVLVAARPSVGKTAFALNCIRNLGVLQKVPVAFFSLEMTTNQIFLRLVAAQSGVPTSKIESGRVSDTEMEQIETAIQQLEGCPIYLNDSCYNAANILAQMRRLVDERGVQAFFLDYIGLVEPMKPREIKAYEIGDITRGFKNFANETKLPMICLAQLNRQADSIGKPQLSMLRDSGNLEQDADSVLFLHRRDLYDPNDKPNQMEVIVAKNRHGATDSQSFHFKKEIGVLSEYAEPAAASWS